MRNNMEKKMERKKERKMRRGKMAFVAGAICSMALVFGGQTMEAKAETLNQPVNLAVNPVAAQQADTSVYGNSAGNILNGGLLSQEGNYLYLYQAYEDRAYKMDRTTGISKQMGKDSLLYLNRIGNKLYGYRTQPAAIVEVDTQSGAERVLRQTSAQLLTAVDRELYYITLPEGSIRKLNLDTMQETVLVGGKADTLAVYRDKVYFSFGADNNALYSVSRNGGAVTKLNNTMTYMALPYQDKIYYLGAVEGGYAIRAMGLDGSNDVIVANTDAFSMNISGNRLFYIDNNGQNKICSIDLSTGQNVIEEIALEAKLKAAINRYGMIPVSNYQVKSYAAICVEQNTMLFLCAENIDGQHYQDEYLYDFVTGEVLPVAYYCVDERRVR